MFDLKVIYEDDNLLAVNKPAGILVHPIATGGGEETVVDWLKVNRPQVRGVGDDSDLRPGIVHRLDRDTSGVLIVAKTQQYFEYLKSLFQTRELNKTYLALVYGKMLKGGTIDKPIGIRNGSIRRTVTSKHARMVKAAVTDFRIKGYVEVDTGRGREECTVLEVMPHTGRTHQIRVHLASIGLPVVGDKLYGGKSRTKGKAGPLYLHAYSLELPLETGKRVMIVADPPKGLADIISRAVLT